MKKILFAAYSLDVGGIETSLVTLLNYLSTQEYEITLVLEKKQGIFLNSISEKINIIEYSPKSGRHRLVNKICNLVNRFGFIQKYKNRFDFSCAYATYSLPASFVARTASKNCALWVHSSYLDLFNENEKLYKQFFIKLHVNKYKNIIFVSNRSKKEFEKVMCKSNTVVCNNIIDYKSIKCLAEQKIKLKKSKNFTFLYVGRITENSKKISRLIEAAIELKNNKLAFKIIIIGDGKEMKKIKSIVKSNELNDYITFLGELKNPYPYFKIADALILVSENEGYPVVYNEAKTLGLPILTTNVSDSKADIQNRYGIVCNQKLEDIVEKMEHLVKNGFTSEINELNKFDPESFNNVIIKKIEKIINEE